MDSINDSMALARRSLRPTLPAAQPTAGDCMTRHLIVFHQNQPLKEVIELLLAKRISGGPVVDDHRRLVGMLSEMDCLRTIAGGAYDNDPFERGRSANDVMSRSPITVESTTGAFAMVHLFAQHSIRRLPVVDSGILVGQVSRRDVLRLLNAQY